MALILSSSECASCVVISRKKMFRNSDVETCPLTVGEQRPQCSEPHNIRGEVSPEGPGPRSALPCGGDHCGPTQLLLQNNLQRTETQG